MMKKIFITFCCLLCLSLQAENISAGNPKLESDSEEYKKVMQEHSDKMRFLKPGKHQEMVEKAGGKITNCCSCHVELCDKGAGEVFKK